jgi:hypothetical protein
MDYFGKLASENNADLSVSTPNESISYTYDSSYSLNLTSNSVVEKLSLSTTRNVIGRAGQSLVDLCVQCIGGLDNFVKFANENNATSLHANDNVFKTFTYNINDIEDAFVSDEYFAQGISIKSGSLVVGSTGSGFILLENGAYLLQENGFKFKLETTI